MFKSQRQHDLQNELGALSRLCKEIIQRAGLHHNGQSRQHNHMAHTELRRVSLPHRTRSYSVEGARPAPRSLRSAASSATERDVIKLLARTNTIQTLVINCELILVFELDSLHSLCLRPIAHCAEPFQCVSSLQVNNQSTSGLAVETNLIVGSLAQLRWYNETQLVLAKIVRQNGNHQPSIRDAQQRVQPTQNNVPAVLHSIRS